MNARIRVKRNAPYMSMIYDTMSAAWWRSGERDLFSQQSWPTSRYIKRRNAQAKYVGIHDFLFG